MLVFQVRTDAIQTIHRLKILWTSVITKRCDNRLYQTSDFYPSVCHCSQDTHNVSLGKCMKSCLMGAKDQGHQGPQRFPPGSCLVLPGCRSLWSLGVVIPCPAHVTLTVIDNCDHLQPNKGKSDTSVNYSTKINQSLSQMHTVHFWSECEENILKTKSNIFEICSKLGDEMNQYVWYFQKRLEKGMERNTGDVLAS